VGPYEVFKFQQTAMVALQAAAEVYMTEYFRACGLQAAHAGHETVLLKDAGLWGTVNQERESAVLVEERVAEAAAEEKRTALKRRRRRLYTRVRPMMILHEYQKRRPRLIYTHMYIILYYIYYIMIYVYIYIYIYICFSNCSIDWYINRYII
jgi:hypothetical protein